MKNTITKMKNTLEEIKSRLADIQGNISDMEDRIMGIIQKEQQKEKKSEYSIRNL